MASSTENQINGSRVKYSTEFKTDLKSLKPLDSPSPKQKLIEKISTCQQIKSLQSNLIEVHFLEKDLVAKISNSEDLNMLNGILAREKSCFEVYVNKNSESKISLNMLNEMTAKAFLELSAGQTCIVKLNGMKKKFLIYKNSSTLVILRKVKRIGRGAFGVVRLYVCVTSLKTYVIKVASLDPSASNQIRNEVNILNYLHRDSDNKLVRDIVGIQAVPALFFTISIGSKNMPKGLCGFLGKEYQGNGGVLITKISYLRNSPSYNLHIMRELFKGLHYLKTKNVFHRDIKMGNLLVSQSQIHFADFGAACVVRDVEDISKLKHDVWTAGYTHEQDRRALQQFMEEYDRYCLLPDDQKKINLSSLLNSLRHWMFARDLYSTCYTLCELIFGIKIKKEKIHSIYLNLEHLLKKRNVEDSLINLFKKALEPDYMERPAIEDFLDKI